MFAIYGDALNFHPFVNYPEPRRAFPHLFAARSRVWSGPGRARAGFALLAGASDMAAIALSAGGVGYAYHELLYHSTGMTLFFTLTGLCLGAIFGGGMVLKEEYDLKRYGSFSGHAARTFWMWNVTFVVALVLVFATKTTDLFSRATMIILYCAGFIAILSFRGLLILHLKRDTRLAAATAQRIFVVGGESEITRFALENDATAGFRLVGASVLRGPQTMTDDLALAAATSRMVRPDDIFILLPWVQEEAIDACVEAFKSVPAAVHLSLERVIARFGEVRFSKVGTIHGLHLVRHPLTRSEVAIKRGFDVLVASALLLLLLPFFVIVGFAIKCESSGPVLFRQRRYGFNQESFRIVKFRSMTTVEDGRHVRQAEKDDIRVTRIGSFIRRHNIDELAQLFNVLIGDMSLVGPRPHAVSHDQLFKTKVADYARRHNVKPGITGWAQVNGLRGPILSNEMIEQRIKHDLYYIDHWSMMFDIKIMLKTVFSRKAFENAL